MNIGELRDQLRSGELGEEPKPSGIPVPRLVVNIGVDDAILSYEKRQDYVDINDLVQAGDATPTGRVVVSLRTDKGVEVREAYGRGIVTLDISEEDGSLIVASVEKLEEARGNGNGDGCVVATASIVARYPKHPESRPRSFPS